MLIFIFLPLIAKNQQSEKVPFRGFSVLIFKLLLFLA